MGTFKIILIIITIIIMLAISYFAMQKDPYSNNNGGFSKKGQYTKNIRYNRIILPLTITEGILLVVLLLIC